MPPTVSAITIDSADVTTMRTINPRAMPTIFRWIDGRNIGDNRNERKQSCKFTLHDPSGNARGPKRQLGFSAAHPFRRVVNPCLAENRLEQRISESAPVRRRHGRPSVFALFEFERCRRSFSMTVQATLT